MKIGEYVLATKYGDGDPGDHWCVGFYNGKLVCNDGSIAEDRNMIIDNNGQNFRANGFRKVKKITREEGQYFLDNSSMIEISRKGIWKILWAIRHEAAKNNNG